jgi:uncharacterized membrane protein
MPDLIGWITHTVDLIDTLKGWTTLLADAIEVAAALIIGVAAIEAMIRALGIFIRQNAAPATKEDVRLHLGRWLAVALEFELGADILRTAVAPALPIIGQLAAIAAIRTALNYFLQREIDHAAKRPAAASPGTPPERGESQRVEPTV